MEQRLRKMAHHSSSFVNCVGTQQLKGSFLLNSKAGIGLRSVCLDWWWCCCFTMILLREEQSLQGVFPLFNFFGSSVEDFFSFAGATGRKHYAFVVLTKTLLQNFDLPLHCARIEEKLLMAYYTGRGLQLFQERKSSKKSVDEGK
jgi:hypothetical protein